MVETIVTIPRGNEWVGLVLGSICGAILGRLGWPGVPLTLPTFLLMGMVTGVEVHGRKLSTAMMVFTIAAAVVGRAL